jgi:hypothetical protein
MVGDRDRRHAELRHPFAELRETIRAIEQGVLAVKMKMDEIAGHLTILSHFVEKRSAHASMTTSRK